MMICNQTLVHSSLESYGITFIVAIFSMKVNPLIKLIGNSDIISTVMLVSELLHNEGGDLSLCHC